MAVDPNQNISYFAFAGLFCSLIVHFSHSDRVVVQNETNVNSDNAARGQNFPERREGSS